ncbi:MAG: hypothetical protein A2017_14850 [Lentisphaerae bacterium GWF2_44_16]|nr:MAG: hypothetical protein A2017_14850 [Lentisphaerae bacterium GWF2_44_16]
MNDFNFIYIFSPLLLAVFFMLRIFPLWKNRDRGCDAFYFLLCAETFHKERKVPITLPYLYMLEYQEQWYPPLFSVLTGMLPQNWLKKRFWLLNHLLDAGVLLTLFVLTFFLAGLPAAFVAGLLYALNPAQTFEFSTMTSRSLALLFFIFFIFFGEMAALSSLWYALPAIFLIALLIYTHKLTIQLLWFLCIFLSLMEWNLLWILLLAAGYCLAAAAYPSMFWKILKSHLDIVLFWHKNWKYLGVHQVEESPVYGTPEGPENLNGFFKGKFILRWFFLGRKVFTSNPWILPILMAFTFWGTLNDLEFFLLNIVMSIYIWAFLTLAPPLRCLGEGTKYIKYAKPFSLLLTAILLKGHPSFLLGVLAALCILTELIYYIAVCHFLSKPTSDKLDPEILELIEILKADENARTLCLPLHLADMLAYYSRRPVLWGTHGYTFKDAQPFFPRILEPLDFFIKKYHLTYILLKKEYVMPEKLRLENPVIVFEGKNYLLLKA